jgi:hypothetical protein
MTHVTQNDHDIMLHEIQLRDAEKPPGKSTLSLSRVCLLRCDYPDPHGRSRASLSTSIQESQSSRHFDSDLDNDAFSEIGVLQSFRLKQLSYAICRG